MNANNNENLTATKLKRLYKSGKIACIAATGLTIRFVYLDSGRLTGTRSGYLVKTDGSIRRFDSDEIAWLFLEEKIKC
jgi:hypothetical protein